MKKIFYIIILSVIVFGCKPKKKADQQPQTTDTSIVKKLFDPELVDTSMDNTANRIVTARRKPPKPGQPPPPVVINKGVLLLDFDGHFVSGTTWNTNGDFLCAGSGLFPDQINTVVNRVKYDYSFEDSLLVTTDENVFYSYPQNKRRRCVITTSYQWYGDGAGGVAYLNSFSWFDDSPCFVFTSQLGYNVKYISDATSHECGHTLGCRHQSDCTVYPNGTCVKNGEYLWGDLIMGASYNSNNPVFGIGRNSLCLVQDDKQIVTTNVRK